MTKLPEALAIAIQHHQAGRLQPAEVIYRRILDVEPSHADALHLLGVIASQSGKHEVAVDLIRQAIALNGSVAVFHSNLGGAYHALGKIPEAADCYRRALELNPSYAEAHNNLGVACKEQGKLDEAAECYRRSIALKPDYAEPHSNLGAVFKDQGKLEEAIACQRRAIEIKPDFAEAHNNLGVALKEHGQLDDALACYHRALAIRPAYPEAHSNLGNVLKEAGKLDEAIACYRRAMELRPGYAEVYGNLGAVLIDQGKCEEAAAACRRALELKPDYVEAHVNLGNAFKDQGMPAEAMVHYRRALELKPEFAGAHYNMGVACETVGDMAAAEAAYRAALRHNVRMVFAHHKLATLLGGRLPEEDVAVQRKLLEDADLTDEQRLYLHFGLARVFDSRGDYAEAARHMERGNALQLAWWGRRRPYDPREHTEIVGRLIDVCSPDFFRRVRSFGLPSETPVFIVGLPRSGTTLLEQILAAHSQVFGAGETQLGGDTMNSLGNQAAEALEGLSRLDRETAQRLASQHLEKLRELAPTAGRIVDKMPDNYMLLGPLACLFPQAKFIHCRRDLRDTAISCWMTRFEGIRWANDPQHIVARFRDYRRVMDHWRKVLPVPLLEVDYEETVADLGGVARRIVAFCGLEWEPGCLEFHRVKRNVTTASSVQVRQPLYASSVGRWKHYRQPLAALLEAVEGMSKFK